MARVERFTSTQPVPVERAQLVDPAAFRFSFESARTLQQIGGVLTELGERKIEMQDRIGVSNINAAMKNAELEYQKEIIGKPLEEHAAILLKHRNNAMVFAGQQRLSPDTRKFAENKLGIWGDVFTDTGELATIKAIERDAIIRVTSDYEEALTEGNAEDIIEAEAILDEQFKSSYTPAEAKVLKEKAEQRAIKQMEENAKQAQMNLAAINPNQITNKGGTGTVDVELKSRAKGKKPSQEFALLSNTDLEAVRDYANSVGEKAKSDSKIAVSAAIEDNYAKIISGDVDIASMITAIQADPTISDEDSNTAAVKIRTFFSTWNSTIDKKVVTLDSTRIKALKIISSVRNAALIRDEGLEAYKKLSESEKINGTDGKGFINQIFAAAKSAKDTEARRRNAILDRREKQVRDAIETQFSLFPPEDIDEILEDFANVAVIRFRDTFDEGDITEGALPEFKNKVDGEVDDLIRKFRLSGEQQIRAVSARQLQIAETFKEQQDELTIIIESLVKEGETEKAKVVMEEAVSLGLLESESKSGDIKKKNVSGKTRIGKGVLQRILDVLK